MMRGVGIDEEEPKAEFCGVDKPHGRAWGISTCTFQVCHPGARRVNERRTTKEKLTFRVPNRWKERGTTGVSRFARIDSTIDRGWA